MAEHLSDEEQLENLKRWWKENGVFTIVAVVLCVGGYFGFDYWKDHRQQQIESASVLYQQMMEVAIVEPGQKVNDTQFRLVNELATQLKDEFGDSQYARYGALLQAKLAVERSDLVVAAEKLQWAMEGADEGLTLIVKLRLAKVEAARGNVDLALSMLNGIDAKTMASAYAEAQGDFHLLKGDKSAAYEAYQLAMNLAAKHDERVGPALQIKLNQVMPATNTTSQNSAEGDA